VKKVAVNGKSINRKVTGNRTWKGVDKGRPIYDKEGCCTVRETKNFVFMNKMKMKLGYNMKELVLDKRIMSHAKFKDYAFCQIKRKVKKERSSQEEDICSFKPSVEEEHNPAIEEELNTCQSSLVTNGIPFPQADVEQYCQKSMVTYTIPFPESAKQYCQFSGLQGEALRSDQIDAKVDEMMASGSGGDEEGLDYQSILDIINELST
jgi:hypothetical protein